MIAQSLPIGSPKATFRTPKGSPSDPLGHLQDAKGLPSRPQRDPKASPEASCETFDFSIRYSVFAPFDPQGDPRDHLGTTSALLGITSEAHRLGTTPQGRSKAPQGTPEGPPRTPKGAPRDPQGTPKDPQGTPKDAQGTPKGPPRYPKTPSGPTRAASLPQSCPQDTQRRRELYPRGHFRHLKTVPNRFLRRSLQRSGSQSDRKCDQNA